MILNIYDEFNHGNYNNNKSSMNKIQIPFLITRTHTLSQTNNITQSLQNFFFFFFF